MRERLIGAAVLVIIAVILIPWLVSHSHHPREQVRTLPVPNIESTAAPAVLTLPPIPGSQVAVARAGDDGAVKDNDADKQTNTAKTVTAATTTPVLIGQEDPIVSAPAATVTKQAKKVSSHPESTENDSKSVAHSTPAEKSPGIEKGDWYLQVASFSSLENADSMVEKLEQAGFAAAIAAHEVKGKTWHRVQVGPYPDETAARKAATQVHSISGTQPLVRQAGGRDG